MDTKWKKFSRSIPVRVVLNILLIASIILGGIVVDHIAGLAMKADELRSKVYANEDLCGNEQLVEEVQNNLQEALNYTLQKVCLVTHIYITCCIKFIRNYSKIIIIVFLLPERMEKKPLLPIPKIVKKKLQKILYTLTIKASKQIRDM